MSYNANIPQATDVPANSELLMLNNFTAINSFVNVNHGPFNSTNEGKHKFVSLVPQSVYPTILVTETGLFNKTYTTTSAPETYIHRQSAVGPATTPMSASILSTDAPINGMDGWTFLPSGILCRWQSISGNGLTTITVTGTPAFTNIFSVFLVPVDPSTTDSNTAVRFVDILSATQFRVYFSSRTSVGAAAGNAKALIIGA